MLPKSIWLQLIEKDTYRDEVQHSFALFATLHTVLTRPCPSVVHRAAAFRRHAGHVLRVAHRERLQPRNHHQPFLTITAAQTAVRALSTSMTGNIVVYLRAGVYPLALR